MFRNSFIVTSIFVFSTIIQLISNVFITRVFGAKIGLDMFLAAVTIPTIIVTVIYSTLTDAFLPLYGELKIKNDKKANNYLISTLFLLVLFSLIVSFILFCIAGPISYLLYKSRGEVFVKNVTLQLSIMTWCITPSIIATLFGAYFYFQKKFTRFPFGQLMGSLFNLLFIVLFYKTLGIWSLVISFVLNIIFQIFFIMPKIRFNILKIKYWELFGDWKLVIGLLVSWFPLIIGNFALRSDILLIRSFGSSLPTGYLVYLNLITKIFSLASGVTTIGIQIVLLPHLVEEISKKNYQIVINKVKKAKIGALITSLFVGSVIILFSPPVIKALFVGGKFSVNDYQLTINLISYFFLAAIGWGAVNIFFQPLLALKKTWAVGFINLFSLLFAWILTGILNNIFTTLTAISWGVTSLLFINILLAEIFWHYYKNKILLA